MIKITNVGGNAAGEASHLAVQTLSGTEILTAMKNGSDNLELIGWSYKNSTVTRAASVGAGTAQEVALALLGRKAVTAVRSGSDNLLLISWEASSGLQNITRLHDTGHLAGEASEIAITAINSSMVVTACRNGSGNLLLICWGVNADGSFTRLGDSNPPGHAPQAGEVSLVTIANIGNNIVVTAVKNGSDDLELIAWQISSDGKTIHRQNPIGETAGTVGEIALTTFDNEFGQRGVITAVQNGAGNLLLIAWNVLDQGMGFQRLGDTSTLPANQRPGTASHISISPSGNAANSFLASMRRGSGDLELIAFTLNHNGGFSRDGDIGSNQGTDITETALCSFFGKAVTATRKANFLNVGVWEVPTVSQVQGVKTASINQWFASVLADPAKADKLRGNWMKLIQSELPLSEAQKEHLSLVPAEHAKELQSAIGMVVQNGGKIHIDREDEHSPGTLVVEPNHHGTKTAELTRTAELSHTAEFSLPIFHCTFDANCRHWHCGWGPAKKKVI